MRDGRAALIDFGQAKELDEDLRKKLCAFYLAINSKNNLYILKTFADLGIELDIRAEDVNADFIEMIPHYANGMFDTAPLPDDIEINPFSDRSPLKKVPIKSFNSDLFMILRTMGLLRSLSETLNADSPECWMSTIFQPYAARGIRQTGMSKAARGVLSRQIQAKLSAAIPSPFESVVNGKGLFLTK